MKRIITSALMMMAAVISSAQSQATDYEQTVTPESPVDFTELIVNAGFETSDEGWVNEAGFKTFGRATWRGIMDDYCLSGAAYLNLFHDAGVDGRIVQTLTGVPNGVYSVTAGVFTNTAGANIFANENLVPAEVNATQFYTVYALVKDSTTALGYYSTHQKDFWSVVDNFSLTYYGNSDDARKMYEKKMRQLSDDVLDQAYSNLLGTIRKAQELLDVLGGQYHENLSNEIEKAQQMYDQLQAPLADVNGEIGSLEALMSIGQTFKETHEQMGSLKEELAECIETFREACLAKTVAKAEQLLTEMEDAFFYLDKTTIEEMNDYIAQCKTLLEELKIPAFISDDEVAQDCTNLIVNPGFENGLEGWINEPTFQECKPTNWAVMLDGTYMTGSYYINLFCPAEGQAGSLSQTISDIPAGKYYVGASVYSNREGVVFFANDIEIKIPVGPASAPYGNFFGTYIRISEGETLTIGVRTNESTEFWGGVDNFTLTRYVHDANTAIQQPLHETDSDIKDIYTLTGVKASDEGKGIRIVRYGNGKTRKIIM